MKQWVIMGAYEKIGSALICVLPRGCDSTYAAHVIQRITCNPSNVERIMIGNTKNIWAEEVDVNDSWWNENCD